MGHTLTLFGFLFKSCDTFRQLVVSSTGSLTFTTTVCCLRVCAFGFVPSGLLPFSIASDVGRYEPHGWYWVWSLRGSWILVCTVLSSSKFSDVSFICIFPCYRPSMFVISSHMKYSDYLVELVYLIGICYLPFGLLWDILILCFYMLPMIWGLFYMIHLSLDDCVISFRDFYYAL